ncbi:MAG: hypothetical protein AAFV72_09350 [Cyanobacteria bacterium J06635_1]
MVWMVSFLCCAMRMGDGGTRLGDFGEARDGGEVPSLNETG